LIQNCRVFALRVLRPDNCGGAMLKRAVTEAMTLHDNAMLLEKLGQRTLVLVGMMGSGKTSVGKRLAQRLGLAFVDADTAIETAAGMTIPEIFAVRGESDFRAGERRVIARLLLQGRQVLATGGGAFMNEETRAAITANGISVWLKADHDVLIRRVRKRANRPLLQTQDPEATMRNLLSMREPFYRLADITIQSRDEPHDVVVDEVITALRVFLTEESPALSNSDEISFLPMRGLKTDAG
jgi:shikimate kinase